MEITSELLSDLVNGWHESARQSLGYTHTLDDGEGITLMLTINRSADGHLQIRATSPKDLFSLISPSDLLSPLDIAEGEIQSIPTATLTIAP